MFTTFVTNYNLYKAGGNVFVRITWKSVVKRCRPFLFHWFLRRL